MDLEQRKARAEALKGREVRRVPAEGLELRDLGDGTLGLTGWASVTERSYDMGFYDETVARGAFATTLSNNPDVQLLINHEGLPLARTVGGTLRLTEDDRGLHVDATVDAGDPDVQRLAPKVRANLIDQMSFAFCGARSEWDEDYTQRRIVSLDIHRGDVSVVNQGANPYTSFSMRSTMARLTELTDDELTEFSAEILALAARVKPAPAPQSEPPATRRSLDWYRARAFELGL